MAANYPHFTSHHHHPYPQPPPPWPPAAAGEREHLFEKPLTPSDVGKLNRLVIPKQHAERHFPLDGESGEKGLILCFEDEAGKHWSFRYSYWASSQSYVLTKGWSRYVKEKRLDAGDVVVFQRLRSDTDRLYIACKRRTDADAPAPPPARWDDAASSSRTLRLFGVDMEYGLVPGSPSTAQQQEARRRELQLLPCTDADPTPRCS